MTNVVLPALAAIAGGLFLLGPLAWAVDARWAARGALALCAAGVLLVLLAVAGGGAADAVEVPFGLPGSGMLLALDALSLPFLLIVFLAGAAASAAALEDWRALGAAAPFWPPLLGALAATCLAADGFSVVLAVEAVFLSLFALVLGGRTQARAAAAPVLLMAALAALCLVPAVALMAPLQSWGIDLSFAGMRATPPQGPRAGAVFGLVLLGAGGLAGLAPLNAWLAPAQAASPGPVAALLGGAGTKVGLYLLIRLLVDLAGPGQPGWWGVPLVALGAAGAAVAALRMCLDDDLRGAIGGAAVAQGGLLIVGLGVAMAARAAALPQLAALALGATLLGALAHGVSATLLGLAAGAAEAAAGTRRLDLLGGLIHRMPATTVCVLAAAASLAALPPSGGFAAVWTLLQALLASWRLGGVGWQGLVVMTVVLVGTAVALSAMGAVRLVGVAFLGRPRTPRVAAAHEVGRPALVAMLALAGAGLLLGLLPGAVLSAMEAAVRLLVGVGLGDRAGLLALAPQPDAAGYTAPALAVVLAVAVGAVLWAAKLRAGLGVRGGAPWEGGAGPPPPWLPFGDPATQLGATGFAGPLRSALSVHLLGEPPRDPAIRWLAAPVARLRRVLSAGAARAVAVGQGGAIAALLAVLAGLLLLAVLADQG